jgi:hypothetical protein
MHTSQTTVYSGHLRKSRVWKGLARAVYIHRIWPYILWFPCQTYHTYTVQIWFWPTLSIKQQFNTQHTHTREYIQFWPTVGDYTYYTSEYIQFYILYKWVYTVLHTIQVSIYSSTYYTSEYIQFYILYKWVIYSSTYYTSEYIQFYILYKWVIYSSTYYTGEYIQFYILLKVIKYISGPR